MANSLVIGLGLYALAFLVLILFWHGLTYWLNRAVVTLVWAALFSLLTIGYFNTHPLLLSQEADALELLKPFLSDKHVDSLTLAQHPFILIDVANQQQLIGSGLEGDSITTRSVTDRIRLAQCLEWLFRQRQDVGQIVCDVLFQQKSAADGRLRAVLDSLTAANKLLIASSDALPDYPLSIDSLFDESNLPLYSVDILHYDGMYFSHQLLDQDNRPGLAYELYLRLHRRQAGSSHAGLGIQFAREAALDSPENQSSIVQTTFIPQLTLTEEIITGQAYTDGQTWLEQGFEVLFPSQQVSGMNMITLRTISLADVVQPEGQTELREMLTASRDLKPIVLLASFTDPQRDVHQTSFGRMHGGLILMNVYYNLLAGYHRISWGYVGYLFFSFTLIIALLFIHKLGPTKDGWVNKLPGRLRMDRRRTANQVLPRWTWARNIITFLKQVFIDELHYWLMLVVIIGAARWFGHLINGAVVIVFLTACSGCLTFLKILTKRRNRKSATPYGK